MVINKSLIMSVKIIHRPIFICLVLFSFLQLICLTHSYAQNTYKLEGNVYDSTENQPLVNASIYIVENGKGTLTDSNGYYSIYLAKGTYNLVCNYVGYAQYKAVVEVSANKNHHIYLKAQSELSQIVIVDSHSLDESLHEEAQSSVVHLQVDKIESLPVMMGEPDVIKTIQLLPGVQSGVEGMTGIYVRGGGADQNLILLDDVPLYNTSHLLGIFSVFNPALIKSADIIKGGFPAQYGGRLSSVIDIKSKTGSYDSLEGEGSVGIMLSRLTIRTPIIKKRTALTVSLRRSYYDLLMRPIMAVYSASQNIEKINMGYYFYDANVRIDHKISDHQHFTLSSFYARDRLYLKSKYEDGQEVEEYKAQVGWGNFFTNAQYKHQFNKNFCNKTSLIFSRYRFFAGLSNSYQAGNNAAISKQSINFYSSINDFTAKSDFSWQPRKEHDVTFGIHNTYHIFSPGASVTDFLFNEQQFDFNQIDTVLNAPKIYANELSIYAQEEWEVGKKLKMNIGLHFNFFSQSSYTALSLQPRFSARYLTSPKTSIKLSYAKMQQNLHLLTNVSAGLPTDLWVPAISRAPSEVSHQVAIGFAAKAAKKIELSVEGYYKTLQNVIEYSEGQIFIGGDENWEDVIEIGKGKAYGVEFMLEKKKGKLSGWLSYTLSWANRQFDYVNRGDVFPYKYDRRHDVSFTANYKFNKKIDLGLVWVYGSGYAYTLSNGYYYQFPYLNSQQGNIYQPVRYNQERNNFRVPAYHRLDVGLNCYKKKKSGSRTWRFGIYNTYNNMNPFMIFWEGESDLYYRPTTGNKLTVLTLLPIVPSVSWAFKF